MSTARLRSAGGLIFAAALIVRVAIVLISGAWATASNPVEMIQVASSLAAGHGFSNPFNCVTGPTAHLAPVYPVLLSILFRFFPPGGSRQLAIYLFSATEAAFVYSLLPWLAVRFGLTRATGVTAGVIGALVPLFFWAEVTSEWEAPLTAILLIVSLGLFAGLFTRPAAKPALATGAAWGALLVTAPTFLITFASLFGFWLWRSRSELHRWKPALTLLAVVAACLTPWTVRNYLVFHEFILIRGNAGLQLHMSFNPLARATYDEGAVSGAFVDHPYTTARVCAEFAQFGEVAMNRKYEKEAIAWILANRGRAASLVISHFGAFWLTPVPSRAKTAAAELLTLFGLAGLWICTRRRLLAGPVAGIVLLTYPLAYYVNFFDPRYRYPLHPLILILAAVSGLAVARKYRPVPGPAPIPSAGLAQD
jgi:hypothetical protein